MIESHCRTCDVWWASQRTPFESDYRWWRQIHYCDRCSTTYGVQVFVRKGALDRLLGKPVV